MSHESPQENPRVENESQASAVETRLPLEEAQKEAMVIQGIVFQEAIGRATKVENLRNGGQGGTEEYREAVADLDAWKQKLPETVKAKGGLRHLEEVRTKDPVEAEFVEAQAVAANGLLDSVEGDVEKGLKLSKDVDREIARVKTRIDGDLRRGRYVGGWTSTGGMIVGEALQNVFSNDPEYPSAAEGAYFHWAMASNRRNIYDENKRKGR